MTTTQELATIEKVDIREIWPDEAKNFTPWLSEHMPELGEALGLDLETRTTEAPVGAFALDILARDLGSDRPVAIENQLGATDHTHLGQLLTYAAGYEANVLIWIAREFKDEHREALDLLNRRTDGETEFFGVVVEVWKIGDSHPAPHFNVVSAPNDWRKSRVDRPRVSGTSERGERYRMFFQELIDTLREEHRFTNARKGQPQSWYSFSSSVSGFQYNASFAGKSSNKARVELYIDNSDKDWSEDKDRNEQRFDQLAKSKEEIDSEIEGDFEWERLDDKRACRISVVRQGSIDDDEEALKEIRDWMIEKLLVFKQVFGPRLAEL